MTIPRWRLESRPSSIRETPGEVVNSFISPYHGLGGGEGGKLSRKTGTVETYGLVLFRDFGKILLAKLTDSLSRMERAFHAPGPPRAASAQVEEDHALIQKSSCPFRIDRGGALYFLAPLGGSRDDGVQGTLGGLEIAARLHTGLL